MDLELDDLCLMFVKMQARQKHKKSAFSKLPPISRGPSAETEKFEHTGGPGSYVKSPSQRSTSPQQKMTHNMMTRSKTRAAAYNPGYIRKVPCALCNIGLEYDEFRCWWRSEKLPPKCQACLINEDPDYDCLENNPRCPCGLLLNMDDMAVWEEDESKTPMCEACLYEMEDESDDESDDKSDDESDDKSDDDAACELCGNNCDEKMVGCCNDGNCPRNIENMCQNCGTWYEKEEVWRCSDCVAAKCDAPPHASKKIPRNIWKEIEKVLKDGLNTYHGSIYDQAEYKDLCLGIVLDLLKNECEFCD